MTEADKPSVKMCHICWGMGVIETSNGDTKDCPNRSCKDGYVDNDK